MLSVRTSAGQNRYSPDAPTEWDIIYRTSSPVSITPLVWCHGNHGTALGDFFGYRTTLLALAQRHVVIGADLGGNTFGNDLSIQRVEEALDYLTTKGAFGPAVLVGASMGGLVAMNWAVRNLDRVAAVAGIVPALNLDAPPGHPAEPFVDAAYPPAYDTGNPEHTSHDPVLFADDFPPDIPIGLWYSNNDTTVPPDDNALAFEAARPETHVVDYGAWGHGGINVAGVQVAAWLETLDYASEYDIEGAYGAGPYGLQAYGGAA